MTYRTLWMTLLVVGTFGCEGRPVEPGTVVDPTYRGEPVAVLRGQMALSQGVVAPPSVRLAIVWYSQFLAVGQPNSVIAQDVVYQGSFPANFTFNFYDVPPLQAQTALPNGAGREANGVLIAYVDTNGNGTLDTVAKGTTPKDQLLGATTSMFDLNSTEYWVHYLDAPSVPGGSSRGFNLISYAEDPSGRKVATVLPFSTPIQLNLTAETELNALVCEVDFQDEVDLLSPNPLAPCGIPATPNVLRVGVSFDVTTRDSAVSTSTSTSTFITLSDGARWVDNAVVTVNGAAVDSMGDGAYFGADPLLPGANTAVITAPGFPARTITLVMPNQGALTSPARGAQVRSGSPMTVSWPQDPLTTLRLVYVSSADFSQSLFSVTGSTDLTTATSGPITHTGEATVNLTAYGAVLSDRFGSFSRAAVRHRRTITFVP